MTPRCLNLTERAVMENLRETFAEAMTDPRVIQLIMTLRRQGIDDQRVLGAIERTPRDLFVDEPFAHRAYDNSALPIACGQTISQPYVVAYVTQELKLEPQMRVLEIGTGSGYQAAVLAPLCHRVCYDRAAQAAAARGGGSLYKAASSPMS